MERFKELLMDTPEYEVYTENVVTLSEKELKELGMLFNKECCASKGKGCCKEKSLRGCDSKKSCKKDMECSNCRCKKSAVGNSYLYKNDV